MGFLDTIGQRQESSASQGSRPAAAPDLIWDDPAAAVQTAPTEKPRYSNSTPAPAIWMAAVFVIAAVGVGAWLAIRNMPATVPPETAASAEAAPTEQAKAAKRDTKRTPTPHSEVVRSSAAHLTLLDTNATASAAENPLPSSSSASETAPAVNVAEPRLASTQPSSDSGPAALAEPLPEDNFVYSGDGTGVVAPRLVSLGFARPVVSGFDSRTSTIELVVSKDGTVERAKISPPSRNWQDAMLLSRAKTFQFVPAQRNGHPVRYRLVMQVDTTP